MNVHLFNAMIDLVLASLGQELGTEIGGVRVNHNVFMDDIVLIARSLAGLQALTNDLANQLMLCGVELSISLQGNSVSICLDRWQSEEVDRVSTPLPSGTGRVNTNFNC